MSLVTVGTFSHSATVIRIIIILFFILLLGCTEQTTKINSGSYGPYAIGDSNELTLEKSEKITHLCSIRAILSEDIYVENPNVDNLSALNQSNGILIWLDHDPSPIRLVLDGNKFIKVKNTKENCHASDEKLNIVCNEVNRLREALEFAKTRDDIYGIITDFETNLHKNVGNYLLGYGHCDANKEWSIKSYREFLLNNDAWELHGLKELSRYNDPFYSGVYLYFENSKLSKIIHKSAPYEMP
jgi:hypothetical protein